jgi:exonuclease SbcC
MLERLRIKNFQAHSKLDVDFDPRVTCIVGSSDTGKSSIIRALLWLVTNKPSGKDFIRNGESSCSVRLECDGNKITRTRGSDNTYKLNKDEFHSFGNNVPEAIQHEIKLGDINFQGQHDSPFWLNDSAGQVSRNLNQIVDLGIIDESLTNIGSAVRKAKTTHEVNNKRLDKSKQLVQDLEWTVGMVRMLEVVLHTEYELETRIRRLDRLRILIEDGKQSFDNVATEQDLIQKTEPVVEELEELDDRLIRISDLQEYITELEQLQDEIDELENKEEELAAKISEIKTCPTCKRPL